MTRNTIGIAAALLLAVAAPAAAQDVAVSLRLGDGPIRVSGYYASRPQYVIPRSFVCEPDGPFVYCWDQYRYVAERPVVYVYPANPRFVVVQRHYRWGRDAKQWRKEARKAMHRWRKAHRYPETDVSLVLAWER
jgi:hypothetical protein